MLQLDIKVNETQAKPAAAPVKFSKRRAIVAASPVKEVQLTWHEEQKLYDRMYESEVWKNGHFFGYRSRMNQKWHDDDASNAIARAEELSPLQNQMMHELIQRQTAAQEDAEVVPEVKKVYTQKYLDQQEMQAKRAERLANLLKETE